MNCYIILHSMITLSMYTCLWWFLSKNKHTFIHDILKKKQYKLTIYNVPYVYILPNKCHVLHSSCSGLFSFSYVCNKNVFYYDWLHDVPWLNNSPNGVSFFKHHTHSCEIQSNLLCGCLTLKLSCIHHIM